MASASWYSFRWCDMIKDDGSRGVVLVRVMGVLVQDRCGNLSIVRGKSGEEIGRSDTVLDCTSITVGSATTWSRSESTLPLPRPRTGSYGNIFSSCCDKCLRSAIFGITDGF